MKSAFQCKIQIVPGGRIQYGHKLASAEFISHKLCLTTILEVYQITEPNGDPFIATCRNQLGWSIEVTAATLAELLEALERQTWLPRTAIAEIVGKLAEKPQVKRGRPFKPQVIYCTRKRRNGSEVRVTLTVGKAA